MTHLKNAISQTRPYNMQRFGISVIVADFQVQVHVWRHSDSDSEFYFTRQEFLDS